MEADGEAGPGKGGTGGGGRPEVKGGGEGGGRRGELRRGAEGRGKEVGRRREGTGRRGSRGREMEAEVWCGGRTRREERRGRKGRSRETGCSWSLSPRRVSPCPPQRGAHLPPHLPIPAAAEPRPGPVQGSACLGPPLYTSLRSVSGHDRESVVLFGVFDGGGNGDHQCHTAYKWV